MQRRGARRSSAGSAVDLMEASFFRSLEAVNGLRPPKAARGTRAIDSLETSEGFASKRSTAWRVTGEGGAWPIGSWTC
jgi:hypothetical protein